MVGRLLNKDLGSWLTKGLGFRVDGRRLAREGHRTCGSCECAHGLRVVEQDIRGY